MNEISKMRISRRCRERFLTQSQDGKRALQTCYLGEYGCGISDLFEPYEVYRRDSGTHLLIFTLEGKGKVDYGTGWLPLLPGTVCILPSKHEYKYHAVKRWKKAWFHPSETDFWSSLMPKEPMIIPSLWKERIVILAEEFLLETTRRDREAHGTILNSYAQLLAHFLRRELNFAERSGDSEHRQRLESLWNQVSENPGHPWTVDTLAKASYFSRSYLQAIVHRIYGHGVMEMVVHLRMERASNLILTGHLKLADIAEQVGYHSPYSFSRAFKKAVGTSPASYRISHLGNLNPSG